jgi:UDP-N-acetylglucosamine 2-epimerase (non-hydrolysing)
MIVVGTRPDAIKMYPVCREMDRWDLEKTLVSTTQHDDLLDSVFEELGFFPDITLNVMEEDQRLADLTGRLFQRLERAMRKTEPDLVLVQGDTTSSMVGALVAFYHRVPIGHVEAGLRTGDPIRPFPEEINRRIISTVTDVHFAPTRRARENLTDEGVDDHRIFVTGNTAIDTLLEMRRRKSPVRNERLKEILNRNEERIAVTAHRRESFGEPFDDFIRALSEIAEARKGVRIVYPVHPNPSVRGPVHGALDRIRGVELIEPLGYGDLVRLLDASRLILTDSGGIQEEAPSLGKPVVVLREKTERVESIRSGIAVLVGMDRTKIVETVLDLLSNPERYNEMVPARNPYGDGRAAERIVQSIRSRYFGGIDPPAEFQEPTDPINGDEGG